MRVLGLYWESNKVTPEDHSKVPLLEMNLHPQMDVDTIHQYESLPSLDDYDCLLEWEYGEEHRQDIDSLNIKKIFRALDFHAPYKHQFYRQISQKFDLILSNVHPSLVKGMECEVKWFPEAAPQYFHPLEVEKDIDVGFYGEITANRMELGQKLNRWSKKFGWNVYVTQEYDWRALNILQNRTKVCINLSKSYDIPRRFFLTLGSGSFLLTEENPPSRSWELFTPGKHLDTYMNFNELREKIGYYLEEEDERKRIAKEGNEEVERKHRWVHRAEELLRL